MLVPATLGDDAAGDGDMLVPKLVDFGIVKLQEGVDVATLTDRGTLIGSPEYMSPEQGQRAQVPPQILLPARDDADGHRLVCVCALRLHDDAASDAGLAELVGHSAERGLVGDHADHCVRSRGQVPWTRLATRMKQVRGKDA